jgi:serine/threonine protein kinase
MKKNNTKKLAPIQEFNLDPGRVLLGKYKVMRKLGVGWEGEVYLIKEINTKIEKAAKFFYPQRNVQNKVLIRYAKKLHKLRHCSILTHYDTQDTFRFRKHDITFLVSEFVEGELLDTFLKRQPGKRLHAFQGLHLLHALASGVEGIHKLREYHGDIHKENVILRRHGLGFDLKLFDMYFWKDATRENIQDDVCDLIRVFYDAIGGVKHYSNQPKPVKDIICGLKKSLIRKKYRTAGQLRRRIEQAAWN